MPNRFRTCWMLVFAITCLSWSTPRSYGQPKKAESNEKPVLRTSVKSIAENPERYLKKAVRLTGRLENQGRNYFTDLNVVLKDAQGNFVHVRPWLPVALPPSPPGPTPKRPEVLSQYLGKQVELTAAVDRGTLGKTGEVYFLDVTSARIVQ